jgi:hypothetical protein
MITRTLRHSTVCCFATLSPVEWIKEGFWGGATKAQPKPFVRGCPLRTKRKFLVFVPATGGGIGLRQCRLLSWQDPAKPLLPMGSPSSTFGAWGTDWLIVRWPFRGDWRPYGVCLRSWKGLRAPAIGDISLSWVQSLMMGGW